MILQLSHAGSFRAKGYVLAVVGSMFWGASGIAGQFLLQNRGVSPEWFASSRMILAGLILLAYDAACYKGDIFSIWRDKREAVRLLIFSVVGMLGVQYTYFTAIHLSNAPTATIIQYTMPILILFWDSLTGRHLPGRRQCLCVGLAIMGTFLIVTQGRWGTLSVSPQALTWGLFSSVAAAFYTVQPKGLIRRWRSSLVVGWGMLTGGIVFSPVSRPWIFVGYFDTAAVLAFAFVVVFGTAVAFWLYLSSVEYISPGEASLLNSVEPLSSIVLSMLIFDMTFGAAEGLGAALIIGTVLMVTKK